MTRCPPWTLVLLLLALAMPGGGVELRAEEPIASSSACRAAIEEEIRAALAEIRKRGWLGMAFHTHVGPAGLVGLEVEGVHAGSPAAEMGVEPGDVVVEIAGRRLAGADIEGVKHLLHSFEVGQRIEVVVERGSERLERTMVARSMPMGAQAQSLGAELMERYLTSSP